MRTRHFLKISNRIGSYKYTPLRGILVSMNQDTEKLIRRLKKIEGQVRGVQNMIESKKYCIDIITQTSAIKQALSSVEDLLLEGHLGHCVVNQIRNGKADAAKNEILKVYKLKRK